MADHWRSIRLDAHPVEVHPSQGDLETLVAVQGGRELLSSLVPRASSEADAAVADGPACTPAKTFGRGEHRLGGRELEGVCASEDPALPCHARLDPAVVSRNERGHEPLPFLGGTAKSVKHLEGLDEGSLRSPPGPGDQGFPFAWIR